MPRHIPLTKGQFALVDDADFTWLIQYRWLFSANGYAQRTYTQHDRRYFEQMHRLIMGAVPGELVDHIDGDRLNNTRANLRIVNRSQNNWNRARNLRSSSDYKGVILHARGWQARIRVYGQRLHLGYFSDPAFAAQVYDAAAMHFFGEYARTNFAIEAVSPEARHTFQSVLGRK
jgi:hypothetical protein